MENFAFLHDATKFGLCLLMLLGRLEYYALAGFVCACVLENVSNDSTDKSGKTGVVLTRKGSNAARSCSSRMGFARNPSIPTARAFSCSTFRAPAVRAMILGVPIRSWIR
jgi:hypothetical protein